MLEVQILVNLGIKEGIKIRTTRKVISGSFLLLMYMLSICHLSTFVSYWNEKLIEGTSLVVQWLRICLQCKGHGFDPGSGKIAHAEGHLNPAPLLLSCAVEPMLCNKRSRLNEQFTRCN